MVQENFHKHDYHITLVEYIKQQNIQRVCTTREKETERHPFFKKKSEKKITRQKKNKENVLLTGHRAGVPCCPVNRVGIYEGQGDG